MTPHIFSNEIFNISVHMKIIIERIINMIKKRDIPIDKKGGRIFFNFSGNIIYLFNFEL